jgi:hypothetical protein
MVRIHGTRGHASTAVTTVTIKLGDEHPVPVVEVVEWDRQDLRSARVQLGSARPRTRVERRAIKDLRTRRRSQLLFEIPVNCKYYPPVIPLLAHFCF